MITRKDVVLAISNSGETIEILTILPLIKRLGVPLISMTGNPHSTMALAATVNIDVSVDTEACPLGLAPTSSTTATLAMGDALAIALLETRGFTKDDFAFVHPGGMLGRRLLLRIDNVMRVEELVPRVYEHTLLKEALIEMSKKGLGMTAVVDNSDILKGVFTDGDLRRALDRGEDMSSTPISQIMTHNCKTIKTGLLAAEAMALMQTFQITALLVTEDSNKLKGVVHIHDLLRAGVA
jgi:arabinose-5-phosphate isomerase